MNLQTLLVTVLASTRAFTPTDLGSSLLIAWYDSSDASTLFQDDAGTTPATADTNVIGKWNDKSGNGYHLTQGTAANKPILKTGIQNGKNTIRFVTNDALVNLSFADFDDTYSVYAVAMYSTDGAADASQAILEVSNGTLSTGFILYHEANARFAARDGVAAQIAVGTDCRDSAFRIHRGVISGSTAYFLNGVAQTPDTYTGNNPNTLSQLRIGDSLLAYRLIGDVAEILICKGAVSAEQNTAIMAYLSTKWGISI